MTAPSIRIADVRDLDTLLPLVRAYHAFEHVELSDLQRTAALTPLLTADSPLGRIWLIGSAGIVAGYAAVCFGYSIEFAGRDAFLDEFFIKEGDRGRGLGTRSLRMIAAELPPLGIKVLHLEVDRGNTRARRVYAGLGFEVRDQFHLMSLRMSAGAPAA